VPAGDDLDTEAVRVQEIGRVVARAVLRAQARGPVVAPAGIESGRVRGIDGDAAGGGDRDVAEARRGRPPGTIQKRGSCRP
jgi:hypothetical protein